ncbi:hypothetical protein JOC48_000656 [Aquibacillus albus]|uniref:Uncharacterized protein n=1 Tax=Aquibacillus albus TaxID=1168171 RepID=A0ABS2MWB6_9BACI|nr:hypothetical protein [Aquibacillus albus]
MIHSNNTYHLGNEDKEFTDLSTKNLESEGNVNGFRKYSSIIQATA